MAASTSPQKFTPKCKKNGDFEAKQCLPPASVLYEGTHCWCSMPDGKIIPDTMHSNSKFPKFDCQRFTGKKKKKTFNMIVIFP